MSNIESIWSTFHDLIKVTRKIITDISDQMKIKTANPFQPLPAISNQFLNHKVGFLFYLCFTKLLKTLS